MSLLWWLAITAVLSCIEVGASLSVQPGGGDARDAAATAAVAADLLGYRHTTRRVQHARALNQRGGALGGALGGTVGSSTSSTSTVSEALTCRLQN